jgi:hypothetical protein
VAAARSAAVTVMIFVLSLAYTAAAKMATIARNFIVKDLVVCEELGVKKVLWWWWTGDEMMWWK